MIEEFICKLQKENQRKIEELEGEMRELSEELNSSEILLAQMQQEQNPDQTIFSPRTLKDETDDSIEKKQSEIDELRRRLDYVGQMRTTELENRMEYQALTEELAKNAAAQEQEPAAASEQVSAEETGGEAREKCGRPEETRGQELLDFLNTAGKKVETSLSLMSGNKNRCRSELRSLLQMIRSYKEKVEKAV